ncbi:MAG: hypothetical protein RR590_07440 [Hungatella sp.]
MWLNQLFTESPIDFEKRCKTRIVWGMLLALLGLAAVILSFLTDWIPMMGLEADVFVSGFYTGTGYGLLAAGAITAIRNIRYLKNPQLKKKREIWETDERNRMLGLRSWAYAGYSMFVLLYIGMLISALVSVIVLKVLLVIAAGYGLLLLLFRILLQKNM